MNESTFSIILSNSVVHDNFLELAKFKENEKPKMDFHTGKISKEDRYLASWSRAAFGGFDKDCVGETFKRGVEIIIKAQEDHISGKSKIKKGSQALAIYNIYLDTVIGVQKIAKTYETEAETYSRETETYKKKMETAEKLNSLAEHYFSKYSELPNLDKLRKEKKFEFVRRVSPRRTTPETSPVKDRDPNSQSSETLESEVSSKKIMKMRLIDKPDHRGEEEERDEDIYAVELKELHSPPQHNDQLFSSGSIVHTTTAVRRSPRPETLDKEVRKEEETVKGDDTDRDDEAVIRVSPSKFKKKKKKNIFYQIFCCGCLKG